MDENITYVKSLTEKISTGDKKAFSQFFELKHQKVFSFAIHFLKDEDEAREIAQKVFIKIWEKRKGLTEINNSDAYLYTISKNMAFNSLKKKISDFAIQKYYKETTDQLFFSTDFNVRFSETQSIIDDIVEKLPPKRRKIFKLSRHSGLSNKEIALRLNTSTSFIENQINKALKTIRTHLRLNEIIPSVILISCLISTIHVIIC